MGTSVKDVVSSGKVVWVESGGRRSSPLRFVADGSTIFVLGNGPDEVLPELTDGDVVTVTGHSLARPAAHGSAGTYVRWVAPEDVPEPVLIELGGRFYDSRFSPQENAEKLRKKLDVFALDLV